MATFLSIAQAVCDSIGVKRPSSVSGGTGDTERRLVALGNEGGKALARLHDWSVLQREHTFTVVSSQAEYDLPSDFGRFLGSTAWDRTAYWEMRGPMSPQQWQVVKSGIIQSTGLRKGWRVKRAAASQESKFSIDPTPDNSSDDLVYEYVSKHWCASNADAGQEAWAADTDVPILDEHLLYLDLKWRMKESFGFSYMDSRNEFVDEAAQAWSRDGGAPVLQVTPSPLRFPVNIPETGYGS